jgi:hypothetical protein
MYFHNNTKDDAIVFVSPNKDWFVGDIGFDIAKSLLSGGASVGTTLLSYPTKLKSLSDLWSLVKYAKSMYSLTQISRIQKVGKVLEADAAARKQFEDVRKLVQTSGIVVKPGETRLVSVKDVFGSLFNLIDYINLAHPMTALNPDMAKNVVARIERSDRGAKFKQEMDALTKKTHEFGFSNFINSAKGAMSLLNPSTFMSVFGFTADLRVMVVDSSLEKSAMFKSNSDHSWIVNDFEIVRSKENEFKTPARKDGWKPFVRVKGHTLLPGEYLSPNDAIMIETSAANMNTDWPDPDPLEEPRTGNWFKDTLADFGAMLRRRTHHGAKVRAQIAQNTVGKALDVLLEWQYLLIYQDDGNLVLYQNNGSAPEAKWSSGTSGRDAWRTYMQEDGNFCVYSRAGKCEWALWPQPPTEAKGGHLLFRQNGELKFVYPKESRKGDFLLTAKKDT